MNALIYKNLGDKMRLVRKIDDVIEFRNDGGILHINADGLYVAFPSDGYAVMIEEEKEGQ